MEIFKRIRKESGHQQIYLFGIKILSYKQKQNIFPCDKSKTCHHKNVYLSICAIFKNEPDIKEWIEYHRIIGVERFYLYDNDSELNEKEILKPYIEKGIVVYKYLPGSQKQFVAYRDAIYRYKKETTWMALIDLDEYILPISKDNVCQILKDYEGYPALAIESLNFDCNDLEKRPKDTCVIEAFNRTGKDYFDPSCVCPVKSIVNPRMVQECSHPHFCIYKKGATAVNENFSPVKDWSVKGGTLTKIRLNHYYTKSLEEYKIKHLKDYADSTKKRVWYPERLNIPNPVTVFEIHKYLTPLKEMLNIGKNAGRFSIVETQE